MVTPCDCARSGFRAVPNTVNPRSARSRAVAWPMPDDAPVTRIVCDIKSPEDCVSDNDTRLLSVPAPPAQTVIDAGQRVAILDLHPRLGASMPSFALPARLSMLAVVASSFGGI